MEEGKGCDGRRGGENRGTTDEANTGLLPATCHISSLASQQENRKGRKGRESSREADGFFLQAFFAIQKPV
jgi:hypothetical protein